MDVKPGFTGEAFPDVFNINAMPKSSKEKKPGQLPEKDIRQYFEKGYLIVENFFTEEELNPCKEGINQLVDELAQKLYSGGKIKNLHADRPFEDRMVYIEKEFPGATILLIKQAYLHPNLKSLFTNERLLNVVEQLIGPDIAGHPVWNLRPKCPKTHALEVPWHQDSGYLDTESYDVLQVTAWIPFVNATKDNGCMQVAEAGHKTGKVATHQCCHGGTWYIMLEEEEMAKTLDVDIQNDIKTCEVPFGGMLLMNNLIPHRSLANLSKGIRWSIDLRWQIPSHVYGFYGLKDGVVMRSSKDPTLKPDWETFEKVDRQQIGCDAVKGMAEPADDPRFDTSIQGPWMKKWEITHVNQHVQAMYDSEEKKH